MKRVRWNRAKAVEAAVVVDTVAVAAEIVAAAVEIAVAVEIAEIAVVAVTKKRNYFQKSGSSHRAAFFCALIQS